MPRLLSGRVGLTSYSGLSTSRNQVVGGDRPFVLPGSFEPNLDKPSVNGQVLYADADGTRRWGNPGGTPTGVSSGISVEDEGLQPVGLGGSIAIINFEGDGVTAISTHRLISGALVGVATVTIPRINFNAEDGQGFVEVSGISTLRVGAGLTVFAPAGTTGIASIGKLTDANLDFYDTSSYLAVTNVAQIQVGNGLSVSEPQSNRAKIDITGNLPNINISGISSIGQGFSTTMYTSGISTADAFIGITSIGAPQFYGALTGNVTGNLSGDVTGDVYAGIVTATAFLNGALNSSGVSTLGQVFASTLDVTGFTTAGAFVADTNGFLGAISHSGVSTLTFLGSTNINATGIVTANAFSGYDFLADSGDSTRVDINVTVATKTGTHRYNGTGSSSGYVLDGVESPFLTLQPGRTYRFKQDDSSNNGHPLRFYYDAGKARAWSDTVTTVGTPGSAGAYTELNVTPETPSVIYYQCTNHGFMGYAVACQTTLHQGDVNSVGVVTASNFVGSLTGNVTGDVTGNVTGNITGNVTGNADTATNATNTANVRVDQENDTNSDRLIPFVEKTQSLSGVQQRLLSDIVLTYNSSTNTLTSGTFSGNHTGDGSALTNVPAGTVALVSTNETNAQHFICFVDSNTGNENVRTDTDLQYNPSTNTITAGTFNGDLDGNSTGLTGTPAITVGNIISNNITPSTTNTYDLGTSSLRWANVWTNDLQLSNKGGQNDVDGTWGDWTLQEGEEDIFMINNRSGKKYKINLTEV